MEVLKLKNKIEENKKISEKSSKSFTHKFKNMFKKDNIDYFDMFVVGADISLEAAIALKTSLKDKVIDNNSLKSVKDIERKGDKHMHQSLNIIEVAFITPIDQGDIMEVLKGIENITDSIDDVANHINMLGVTVKDDFMDQFLNTIISACEKTYDLMVNFKDFKKESNTNINDLVIEINKLEGKGDRIYFDSMRSLFKNENDPIKVIKKKEIYQRFENILDYCENLADLIERIMVRES